MTFLARLLTPKRVTHDFESEVLLSQAQRHIDDAEKILKNVVDIAETESRDIQSELDSATASYCDIKKAAEHEIFMTESRKTQAAKLLNSIKAKD